MKFPKSAYGCGLGCFSGANRRQETKPPCNRAGQEPARQGEMAALRCHADNFFSETLNSKIILEGCQNLLLGRVLVAQLSLALV